MSTAHCAMQLVATTMLAVTLAMVGTAAKAKLTLDRANDGLGVTAIPSVPVGDARLDQNRPRLAIQWSGSNGGDDTPTEDHPF